MTIGVVSRRASYIGNGVSATFAVTFKFFAINVYINSVLVDPSHYTITQDAPGSTGSITFGVDYIPASLQNILILGATQIAQDVDYIENDAFPAETAERVADKLTMIAQELSARIDRSLRLPATSTGSIGAIQATDIDSKILLGDATNGIKPFVPPLAGLVGVEANGHPYIAEEWSNPTAVSVTRETYTGDTFSAPAFMPGDTNVTREYVDAGDLANAGNLTAHTSNTSNPHSTTKGQVGLGNVDNTSDASKPVSTAQQTALDLKANAANAALTGVPTAPTAALGTNTTQIATMAAVKAAVDALVAGAPGALDTLNEIAAQLASDESAVSALTTTVASKASTTALNTHIADTANPHAVTKSQVGLGNVDNTSDANKPVSTAQAAADALKANIASPAFTGVPTAPTASPGTNNTQLATTAYADAIAALKASLASPAFTGTPTAPTPATIDNSTTLATTAYVTNKVEAVSSGVTTFNGRSGAVSPASGDYAVADVTGLTSALAAKADLASPTFTGTPAAPTPTAGDSTTKLATTAYVRGEIAALVNSAPGILDTLGEIAAAIQADEATATALATTVGTKAPLASPALTGTPTAPTPSAADNTTKIATTAFVQGEISGKAPLASPALSGTPTTPTAAVNTNTTQIASTAFVLAQAGANTPIVDGTGAAGSATKFSREDHVHPSDTTKAGVSQVGAICGIIQSPANERYILALNVPFGFTINSFTTKSASGTCTAVLDIDTTNVTGASNSVSSTEVTNNASAANTVTTGQDVAVTVSSNSACTKLQFTIKYTRTLA